jgi:asparaginyl-tRNA synthetase
MSYTTVRQLPDLVGETVTIKGWVLHHRPSGKLVFFELRDGSGYIQCVVSKMDVDTQTFDRAKNLRIETSCAVSGTVRSDERSKYGYEIDLQQLVILNETVAEYPISEKEHGVAFLLENRHLWLRSPRQVAIMKIRSTIIKEARDYLDNLGFISFDTPIFTPTACEGTTTLFETQYFDDTAYLTQSGQLYAEAGAMALGKVYTFGPAFRAEKSKTRRHLTEFWMVEPEAAFYDLDAILIVAENMITSIVRSVLEKHEEDLACIERDINALEAVAAPFPRITYDDAIKMCIEEDHDISWGDDFGADDETILSNAFDKPVIVERYPASCKPFYMKNDPARPDVVLNCDILAPEGYGEIVGGSQREDDYDTLVMKLKQHDIDPEPLDWYLDLRRYGSVPHSGFGLGIERTVTWICGLHHVRESIPFPRMLEKCRP